MESLFPAAVRHINTAIEREILIKAFGSSETNPYALMNIPLDSHIEREVIVKQVVKDIQLFDSLDTPISLDGLVPVDVSDDYSILFIPEHRRGGRDIMSLNGVSYGTSQNIFGSDSNRNMGSNMAAASSSILSAMNRHTPDTEHDAELIMPNTILINNRFKTTTNAVIHVNLAVDNKLSHIRNSTSLPFIELCIWKAKQLAYVNLNISMGEQFIHQGKELGIFSDTVREWKDARETYMELLYKFRKTLKLADPIARKRMIRSRLPRILG